ncbi:hypothetical protein DICSQDRAFT_66655 [Dichomitus squalens LYAD-421 SS1]|uniref:DDE Tnp4 domain-containing protein n=1 Tax=Dichomitus squalens (strain LYAD-421) TaxID=732165 RepID=R7SUC4_DICSQ|nr:uncharacterized protein DICSQDRAFT_66655 [Dichomitus squalens LYAD-421 SS1]EJF58572.1 hypothetical protein DICSQDRAFT_66655 [Dichomitus squalens LYAD-421 SS1]
MDRDAFWHLHDLVKDDPVFVSAGKKPQRPSWLQLAVFLCHMGNESAVKTASFASVSEGAVFLYTERVCTALRNIRNQHIYWPEDDERERFSDAMSEWGFPGCLGSGDGTYIRLEKRPSQNGYAYWCRKKMYAVSYFPRYVDHRGRFTSYDFGWPGSVQDSRVFKSSHLWCNKAQYFRSHEYILVDKGMLCTSLDVSVGASS